MVPAIGLKFRTRTLLGFKAGVSFTITCYFKGTRVAGALVGKNYEDTSQVLPWYLLWNGGADNKVTLYLRDGASASFRANGTPKLEMTNGILSLVERCRCGQGFDMDRRQNGR